VLRDVAEWRSARILPLNPPDDASVGSLVVAVDGEAAALVANLTPTPRPITLEPWLGRTALRNLNDATIGTAMRELERYRAIRRPLAPMRGRLDLTLAPFETVHLRPDRRGWGI
jgi:hypothetical protein